MEHRYEILSTAKEWAVIAPICEKLKRQLPVEGSGLVLAEFDESGALAAFEILHNAVFVEMIWARDGHTNLRRLWNMGINYLMRFSPARMRRQLVTFTADDETGKKLGHVLTGLGCERLNWSLYRREF